MELTEAELAELVRFNLDDVIAVDHPGAIDAFNAGKRIFDVSDKAKKLHAFVIEHKIRGRIESNGVPPGDWPYPFERFWDRPVYLIHGRRPGRA